MIALLLSVSDLHTLESSTILTASFFGSGYSITRHQYLRFSEFHIFI